MDCIGISPKSGDRTGNWRLACATSVEHSCLQKDLSQNTVSRSDGLRWGDEIHPISCGLFTAAKSRAGCQGYTFRTLRLHILLDDCEPKGSL